MNAPSEENAGACPLCYAGGRARIVYRQGPWRVRVCRRCGHGWTDPRPGPEVLARAYGDPGYYADRAMAAGVLPDHRTRARALAATTGRSARVLEVGSGTGALLAALRDEGPSVMGVEPWPEVAAASEKAHGIDVRVADIESPGFRLHDRFDAVLMIHVLEHLRDPVGALERARALLRPGGLLVLEVPNRRSVAAHVPGRRRGIYDLPLHLHHFTEDSLRRTLRAAGLVDAVVLPSIPRPLDRAAARLAGRGGGGAGSPSSTGRNARSEAPAEGSGRPDEEGGAPQDRMDAASRPQEAGAPLLSPLSLAGRLLRILPGWKLTATARAPEAS